MRTQFDGPGTRFHQRLRWNLASPDPVEDRIIKARALATLWVAGAVLGIVVPLLASGSTDVAPAVLTASLGFPAAALLVRHARLMAPWLLHAAVALGVSIITIGTTFYADPGIVMGVASFFVWPILYVSVFFPARQALGHFALIGMALAIALSIGDSPGAPAKWVLVMGTAAVTGIIAGWVSDQMRNAAATDLLTGLPNRYALAGLLDREVSRATRHGEPLTVGMLDLDQFKEVNDSEGHLAGDRVLAAVAERWRAVLRDTDVLTRFAGDEFVVLLPHTSGPDSLSAVERLNEGTAITCSVGLAQWRPGDRADDVLARADEALYEAKSRGEGVILLAKDDPRAPVASA